MPTTIFKHLLKEHKISWEDHDEAAYGMANAAGCGGRSFGGFNIDNKMDTTKVTVKCWAAGLKAIQKYYEEGMGFAKIHGPSLFVAAVSATNYPKLYEAAKLAKFQSVFNFAGCHQGSNIKNPYQLTFMAMVVFPEQMRCSKS